LVIGGYSVAYHGYPRATADLDVWVAISPENAQRIVAALKDFGFSSPDLSEALFLNRGKVIRMGVPPLRIEVLTDISGVDFAECYGSREVGPLGDVTVNIIDLEHLKKNKRAAGRHKDLADLQNLP
jgi:hypothetical protein